MNSRDRIFITLEHEEPDRVPLTDHIYMPKSLEGILGKTGVRTDTPKEYVEVHKILGLDLITVFPTSFQMAQVGKDIYIDEWGVKWKVIEGMPWYMDGTLKKLEDLDNFIIPDPNEDIWYKPGEEIIRLVKGELATAAVVEGPFTRSWLPMGFTTFVKMLRISPNKVYRFIEKVTSFFIEQGKQFIDRGVDLIWIPDDMGYADGLMLSPELLRKFIFPSLEKMIATFKAKGVKVLMHNDGQIMRIMDDLIRIGIDAIHPIERAAGMDLKIMKEEYGDKITLIGNVNSKTVLQYGSFDEIKKQVLECLEIAAPGGGYILASDHSIHEGIPSINVKFMFEVAKKYGKYPITKVR